MEIRRMNYVPMNVNKNDEIEGIVITSPIIKTTSRGIQSIYRSTRIVSGRINCNNLELTINTKYQPDEIEQHLTKIIEYIDKKEKEINRKITNHNKWVKKTVKDMIGKYDPNKISIGIDRSCELCGENDILTKDTVVYIKPINDFGTLTKYHELFFEHLISFLTWNAHVDEIICAEIKDNGLYITIPLSAKKNDTIEKLNQIADLMFDLFSNHDCNKVFEINDTIDKFTRDKSNEYMRLYGFQEYIVGNDNTRYPALTISSEYMNLIGKNILDRLKNIPLIINAQSLSGKIRITLDIDENTDIDSQLDTLYNELMHIILNEGLIIKNRRLKFLDELKTKINEQFSNLLDLEIDQIVFGQYNDLSSTVVIKPQKIIKGTEEIRIIPYNIIRSTLYGNPLCIYIPYHCNEKNAESELIDVCKRLYGMYEQQAEKNKYHCQMIDNFVYKHNQK